MRNYSCTACLRNKTSNVLYLQLSFFCQVQLPFFFVTKIRKIGFYMYIHIPSRCFTVWLCAIILLFTIRWTEYLPAKSLFRKTNFIIPYTFLFFLSTRSSFFPHSVLCYVNFVLNYYLLSFWLVSRRWFIDEK